MQCRLHARQMDRHAFRVVGEQTGWYDIDPDIMSQAGEGGLESRSFCPRITILGWHHRGVCENFEVAHGVPCPTKPGVYAHR